MTEQNELTPDESENSSNRESTLPSKLSGVGKPISRRDFGSKLQKVVVIASLAHFTLLAGGAQVTVPAGDACPGGGPLEDVCKPTENNPDKCPGEAPPEDSCSPGDGDEDKCNTGIQAADVCEPENPAADKCESGMPADDSCPDKKTNDNCPTGQFPDDECDPGGTDAQGDQCPGGDPTNGLDTCEPEGSGPSGGDDCSAGSTYPVSGKDDCKAAHPDICSTLPVDDDFCPNGTNTPSGDGGDDKCVGIEGSDQCTDGTDATDVCTGTSWDLHDTCPGGGTDVDHCGPVGSGATSDDYCFQGTNSDECKPPSDEDACPMGLPAEDVCNASDPDECVPGVLTSDQTKPPQG